MSVAVATMMARRAGRFDAERPLLRGICLVVKGSQQRLDRHYRATPAARGGLAQFPARPNAQTLSESIPLFFIARNGNGLWVAREAEGRTGGVFLFKRSAIRFAENHSAPVGCATMFPSERLELDVDNRGGVLAGWIDAALRMAARRKRSHAAAMVATSLVEGQRR
jgi:hypothetical protein